MSDNKIDWSDLDRLLGEIQNMPSEDHIPESVLRAYLGQEEIEEEIEQHLLDCVDCQTLADVIIAENSPWQNDVEHREELKAKVLSRGQANASGYLPRLQTALEKLAAAREDMRTALTTWRDGLVRGYLGAEATVRVDLSQGLSVLQEFSGHGLTVVYRGTRGGFRGSQSPEEAGEASSVVVSTDRLSSAQVRIENGAIEARFLDWNAATPPLVLLLPETDADEAQAQWGEEDSNTGMFVARFDAVTTGSFLLTIASPDEPEILRGDHQPKEL